MSFGDVIRQAASPATEPLGIGGDESKIWHCDGSPGTQIYELAITDFSVLQNRAGQPSADANGIGGTSSIIWHCESYTDFIYKLKPSDLSIWYSRQYPLPQVGTGIGGDNGTIWHSHYIGSIVYELSTINFSVIRSASGPSSGSVGIGGNASVIWHCDWNADNLYELSPTDFSVVRTVNSPGAWPSGIGGNTNVIWHCDEQSDQIYELDAAYVPPTYTISGNVKSTKGTNLHNASLTFENGTSYSTNTDINGDYSQAVVPDIYTVAVSKEGHCNNSDSVDASSSNVTKDFALAMPIRRENIVPGGAQRTPTDGENREKIGGQSRIRLSPNAPRMQSDVPCP